AIDIIIFDPPRKGLDRKIIETVSKAKIKKIIYASCDPITQKRDVELFLEKGYRFSFLQPFDMFPQTFHIENVIILEMK
ncbi:MAG: 23S rRNA (uracil-5-)-methyltransferase RumA, partial [Candidatus Cloacimonadota bacterium]